MELPLQAVTLDGQGVRLEPLSQDHAQGLYNRGRNSQDWAFMPRAGFIDQADARHWVDEALAETAQLPFAIKDEKAYTNRLLDSIETLLTREYATDAGADARPTLRGSGAPAEPRAEETSVARLSFAPAGERDARQKATRGG